MKIVEVRHPLIQHKLGLMRRAGISTKEFRELAAEVAALLTYEATKDLETIEEEIEGWAGTLHVHLELGGKNGIIVMDDADLDLAVEGIVWSAFGTSGQRCTAASRAHSSVRARTRFAKLLDCRAVGAVAADSHP